MRTDKIRKYLIPNIPYLFILWAFLKLGTAYRLAAGNDFAHNQNAIRAAARIDFLRPEDGTSPYQLQPFVKRENKEMSR